MLLKNFCNERLDILPQPRLLRTYSSELKEYPKSRLCSKYARHIFLKPSLIHTALLFSPLPVMTMEDFPLSRKHWLGCKEAISATRKPAFKPSSTMNQLRIKENFFLVRPRSLIFAQYLRKIATSSTLRHLLSSIIQGDFVRLLWNGSPFISLMNQLRVGMRRIDKRKLERKEEQLSSFFGAGKITMVTRIDFRKI